MIPAIKTSVGISLTSWLLSHFSKETVTHWYKNSQSGWPECFWWEHITRKDAETTAEFPTGQVCSASHPCAYPNSWQWSPYFQIKETESQSFAICPRFHGLELVNRIKRVDKNQNKNPYFSHYTVSRFGSLGNWRGWSSVIGIHYEDMDL